MKTQGITFLLTLVAIFISLTGCFVMEYSELHNTIWQQLCYALFSASIISCVLSYVYYRIEKQKMRNKYFSLFCFLYQKILNINILIKYRITQNTTEEIISDKNIVNTYESIRNTIQNAIEELRPLEYWQICSSRTQEGISMIKSNIPLMHSLTMDLISITILNNQWSMEDLNPSNKNPQTIRNLIVQYNTQLSNIRGQSDTVLVLLESAIFVLMKKKKGKLQYWQSMKQEMEVSAKQFNHIP